MAVRCRTAKNGFESLQKACREENIRAISDAKVDPSTNLEAAIAKLYQEKLKGKSLNLTEGSKQFKDDNIARNIQLKRTQKTSHKNIPEKLSRK